jgi:aryl-alcohol dehydrogenase-like predicted oxidoreductase
VIHRPLGRSGLEIHPVITGTFAMGGWWWGPSDETQGIGAIQAALDAGASAIDTAPVYGFGHAEELVGQAIRGRREQAILMTKVGLRWDGQGTPFFPTQHRGQHLEVTLDLRPENIRAECEASLRRLNVDYIDLYQCHWPDPATPIAESMGALLRLREEGKIRAIGVSNYSLEQMEEAQAALGDVPLASTQPHYSLLHRRVERDLLPHCTKNRVGLIAYRPMEQGLLTGKMGPNRVLVEGDERGSQPIFSHDNRVAIQAALGNVQELATAKGLSLAQLSVAWVLHQEGVTGAICGARGPQQAKENTGAAAVSLSSEELECIAKAFLGLPIRKKK